MQAGSTFYKTMLWRGMHYITAFVVNILIARYFKAAVSGELYYISSIYSLILLFSSLGIDSGIIYFASGKKIGTGKLLHFSLAWTVLTGTLVFLVVYYFVNNGVSGFNHRLLLFSAVTFICGNLLMTYCTGLCYAKNDFVTPNAVSIVTNLMLVAVLPFNGHSIIPVINGDNYFYIYFCSFLLQGLVLVIFVQLKYVGLKFAGLISFTELKLMIVYCAMAYAANIIFFFLYRIDYWFVEKYCSAEELGNYIQVSRIGQMFFILPTILASVVFPLTAGGQKEKINSLLTLISRSILFLYLLACLLLSLIGKWLFPLLFGESFSGMYQPFLFLIPGILSLSGLFTLTAYYAGKNRIKVNIIGSVLALLVILAGDSIFIPVYGINAAALVSSIGYIVYQVYVLWVFTNEYKTAPGSFFIFRLSDWHFIKEGIARSFKRQDEKQQQ